MSSGAELPSGTVTFLFTDIEGSTQLLKRLRDAYGEALEEHQRILREVFEQHDGREIDTQGDSFFVAFRRAKDAVGAAVDAQHALSEHVWPEDGELRVRMGIHTGEPAVGGERYVGLGVHRAARICAAGHGGQVLVSQTTRELVRDDPPPDVSLRDLGEHQLKDLDEPERIYQLVAPGLAESFAPLKTAAPTPFAGREGESDVYSYFGKVDDSRLRIQTGYFGWGADYPSAGAFLRAQFGCAAFVPASPQQSADPNEWCDRALDAQMDHAAAVQAQDPPAGALLWQRIERELLREAVAVPDVQHPERRPRLQARRQLPVPPTVGRATRPVWVK